MTLPGYIYLLLILVGIISFVVGMAAGLMLAGWGFINSLRRNHLIPLKDGRIIPEMPTFTTWQVWQNTSTTTRPENIYGKPDNDN